MNNSSAIREFKYKAFVSYSHRDRRPQSGFIGRLKITKYPSSSSDHRVVTGLSKAALSRYFAIETSLALLLTYQSRSKRRSNNLQILL